MQNSFLMRAYPLTDRNGVVDNRKKVSDENRRRAQKFDEVYFDSSRDLGYGGYKYNSKYFKGVVKDFKYYYNLNSTSKVLDIGCAKGFMLHDLIEEVPGITIAGIDISSYAISNALDDVKEYLQIGCCSNLPFADKSFDLAISISTIHNLDIDGVRKSLLEIMRVSEKSFIKVNGYKNLKQREMLEKWNLVAKTILHVNEWEELFSEIGYTGDYDFFNV